MTNKEAAERLDDTIPLSGGETPGAMENYELDKEALKQGAEALRRLDKLERWAKAWEEWYDKKNVTDGKWFMGLLIRVLNGEMTWPEAGGKP